MYGKNVNFSNLASLVALRVCFGLQGNSDVPFTHPFYFASCQILEVTRIEMKTRELYMLFHLHVVS